jgi:tetratricopeptide (TPR) repeat protein
MYAGLVHLAAGQTESATAAFQSARVILEAAPPGRPEDPALHRALGLVYAGLGMKEEAIREGQRAVGLLPISRDAFIGPSYVMSLARIYTLVGEYEAAINEIEYVLSAPYLFASAKLIQLDPAWDPLRSDPRFGDLLRRMNNPPN